LAKVRQNIERGLCGRPVDGEVAKSGALLFEAPRAGLYVQIENGIRSFFEDHYRAFGEVVPSWVQTSLGRVDIHRIAIADPTRWIIAL
jgi:hypothetical protein